MRLLWLLLVVSVASQADDWVEEEELEEPYNEDESYETQHEADHEPEIYRRRRDVDEDEYYTSQRDINQERVSFRTRRDVRDEGPFEEHVRVKRCTYEDVPVSRVRRSADNVRVPRQVHQYEVHEVTDDGYVSSPPYEEMLAASAEHYHKVYAAPGAPSSARYLNPEVSAVPIVYRPVSSVSSNQNFQSSNHNAQYRFAPTNQNTPQQHPAPAHYAPNPIQYVEPVQFVPVKASIKVADVPSSVKNPIGIIQASGLGPVPAPFAPVPVGSFPVASVEAVPVTGDQLEAAAVVKHHQHATGHKQGGGHGKHAQHDAQRGGKSSKGFKHDHHVDKGAKGFKQDELHRKEYEEAEGKKKKHHDHADHKGSHEEQAHGHKGAKFDEKKGHKKGHKTKGYHNKYHKDEFHKEHKFYDDYHKSGEHHRYGKFNAKHASDESGKKKAHHVNAGHDFVERGKKGYSNKGHLDADHKGYNGKAGHEEHHEKHSSHGKKGGKAGGAHWSHAKKN